MSSQALKPESPNTVTPRSDAIYALLAIFIGSGLALFALSKFLPLLVESLNSPEGKGFWDLSRASGVVSYLLFWASIILGLLMSNKMARAWPGGPIAFKLHEFMCLLGITFAGFHAIILLGDHFINFSVLQIAIPFATKAPQSVWIGLGQLSFYLFTAIICSFYIRQWISTTVWRWLHFGTFLAFMLVTAHGLISGSDTKTPFMLILYGLTNLSVFFLTFYRIFKMLEKPA